MQNGFSMILVIFIMVLLLTIGFGISTLTNVSLENSVVQKKEVESTEEVEGILNLFKGELSASTESSIWFDNPSSDFKKVNLKSFIFVSDEEKTFNFDVEDGPKNAYITLFIGGDSWKLDSAETSFVFTNDKTNTNFKSYISNLNTGNYLVKVSSGIEKEYKLVIRLFSD